MKPVGGSDTAATYRDFAEREAPTSPTFQAWATGVADDPEVLDLVASLPPQKQQPNLVFAAARWLGATGGYDGLRRLLTRRWDEVRPVVLSRATQTNEVGRCATMLPVLASLPGPLALLEIGASAGLCLYPDRYSYRYSDGTSLDPVDGPSPVQLRCDVHGDPPMPTALPEVVWRRGIDLQPLDVHDEDAMRWLQTLVWPEHDDRRERLAAAVDVVRREPPRLVRGDLLEELPASVEAAPRDATVVVLHSAVIAYLSARQRERFVDLVGSLPVRWVSNEGPRAVAVDGVPEGLPPFGAPFALALDGRFVAWTEGHGRGLAWP